MTEMERKEILLRAELESVIDTYRRQRLDMEYIPIVTGQVMAYITKALKTTGVLEKRVLVLEKLIRGTKSRINRGVSCYEILASLPTITYDRLHSYSKASKKVILEDLRKEEEFRQEEQSSNDISGTELIEQLIEHFYESFKNLDRKRLIQLECKYNQLIKDSLSYMDSSKSFGEIIGCLNTGMYSKNKNLFIKELNEEYGLGVKHNERFIP